MMAFEREIVLLVRHSERAFAGVNGLYQARIPAVVIVATGKPGKGNPKPPFVYHDPFNRLCLGRMGKTRQVDGEMVVEDQTTYIPCSYCLAFWVRDYDLAVGDPTLIPDREERETMKNFGPPESRIVGGDWACYE